jgi:sec-independent protein translocase protein TatA
MPSWIGPWEIAIVLVIVLLIFGPRKLPEFGSSLGKSIRGFRKGMKDGEDEADEMTAEVKGAAEASEAPVAEGEPVATQAKSETSKATATAERPQCWGTWEEGNEACLQCSIAAQCAEAHPET